MVQVQSQLVNCSYIHSCVYIEFEVQQTGVYLSSCDSPSSMYVSGTDSSGTGNFDNPCTAFNARISLVWCWAKLDHKHCILWGIPARESEQKIAWWTDTHLVARSASHHYPQHTLWQVCWTGCLVNMGKALYHHTLSFWSVISGYLFPIRNLIAGITQVQFQKNRKIAEEILKFWIPTFLLTNPSFMVAPLRGTRWTAEIGWRFCSSQVVPPRGKVMPY